MLDDLIDRYWPRAVAGDRDAVALVIRLLAAKDTTLGLS
jgi:hypothetical protein